MRDEAFIQIKQGYSDSGATPGELHSSISFSQYVPPAPKKKGKVERTRFRESTHTYRQKPGAAPAPAHACRGDASCDRHGDRAARRGPAADRAACPGACPGDTSCDCHGDRAARRGHSGFREKEEAQEVEGRGSRREAGQAGEDSLWTGAPRHAALGGQQRQHRKRRRAAGDRFERRAACESAGANRADNEDSL